MRPESAHAISARMTSFETCSCDLPQTRPIVNTVEVDPITEGAFQLHITRFVACGDAHVVHFVPADPTVRARSDDQYRAILNRGALNVPDGMAIVWTLRRMGYECVRLPGTEAMIKTCAWSAPRGLGQYFYGGRADVLLSLQRKLEGRFPDLTFAGTESPPFSALTSEDLRAAADRIRSTGATFLWVGLGTPKQDLVAEEFRKLRAAPVILCVGAAFDFLAETISRSPIWMQRIGLEWLFRLIKEPRRLWRRYLIGNPKFVAGVAKEWRLRATKPSHEA